MATATVHSRVREDCEKNVSSAIHLTSAVWPCLAEGGRIIYFESCAGQLMMTPWRSEGRKGAVQLVAQNWAQIVRQTPSTPLLLSPSFSSGTVTQGQS